jgi:type II secretory pathway component PulF
MTSALTAYRTLDDSAHRAEFYRMWRAGYSAALPHPKSLEAMGPRRSPHVEGARQWLLEGTTKGRGIAELARGGGARFEQFERAILVLGDEAGSLDGSLRLLADFFMRKHQLMLWVKKQMAQPLLTALFACLIAPFPLLYFGHVRAYVIAAFGSIAVLLLSAGSLVVAVSKRYGRKPAVARARMARALATAVEAGLPLGRALRLAADASANAEIQTYMSKQTERQLSSRSVVETLAACPHLTPDFLAMVDTAERTGDFGVLTRLAELYEDGLR